MSICSMASCSVTPGRATVASKGYRFTTTSSKVRMPCSASGLHVLGIVVPAEDAAVDLGMQRLQPAVHHFRKAGVLGDVADGDALGFQVFAGAAGAVDFHAGGDQAAGEVGQAELVADADQRTLNAGRFHDGYFRRQGAGAMPTLRVVAAHAASFPSVRTTTLAVLTEMSMTAGRIRSRKTIS